MVLVRLDGAGAAAVGAVDPTCAAPPEGHPSAGFSKSTSRSIRSCSLPDASSHALSHCRRSCASVIETYLVRHEFSVSDTDPRTSAVAAAPCQPPAGFSKSTSLSINCCFVPAALSHASSHCFRKCARVIDRYLDRTADSAADIDWDGVGAADGLAGARL